MSEWILPIIYNLIQTMKQFSHIQNLKDLRNKRKLKNQRKKAQTDSQIVPTQKQSATPYKLDLQKGKLSQIILKLLHHPEGYAELSFQFNEKPPPPLLHSVYPNNTHPNNIKSMRISNYILVGYLVKKMLAKNIAVLSIENSLQLDNETFCTSRMQRMGVKVYRIKNSLIFSRHKACQNTPFQQELILQNANPLISCQMTGIGEVTELKISQTVLNLKDNKISQDLLRFLQQMGYQSKKINTKVDSFVKIAGKKNLVHFIELLYKNRSLLWEIQCQSRQISILNEIDLRHYDCPSCSQFLVEREDLSKKYRCEVPTAIGLSIKSIDRHEGEIKDIISGFCNRGGGILLFNCSQKGKKFLPQGCFITQKEKIIILSKISSYLTSIKGNPLVEIKFIPLVKFRLSQEQMLLFSSNSHLVIPCLRVSPSQGSQLHYWFQQKENIYHFSDVRENKIVLLQGRDIAKRIKTKFSTFYIPDHLSSTEKLLMRRCYSVFDHQCSGFTPIVAENSNHSKQLQQLMEENEFVPNKKEEFTIWWKYFINLDKQINLQSEVMMHCLVLKPEVIVIDMKKIREIIFKN